jgi:hypothetical protein
VGFRSSGGGLNGEGPSTPPANLTNVAARSVGTYHPHVVAGFSLRIRAPTTAAQPEGCDYGDADGGELRPGRGQFPRPLLPGDGTLTPWNERPHPVG